MPASGPGVPSRPAQQRSTATVPLATPALLLNVGQLLTNLALEEKLNWLLDAGNQAMRLSRTEFWATLDDFPPPQH